MAHRDYLAKRNSGYHFRIRVPFRLQDAMGRKEVRRSLGTNSLIDAKVTAAKLARVVNLHPKVHH